MGLTKLIKEHSNKILVILVGVIVLILGINILIYKE